MIYFTVLILNNDSLHASLQFSLAALKAEDGLLYLGHKVLGRCPSLLSPSCYATKFGFIFCS